jgi:Flp pilus assembly protein TadG
VWSISNQRGSAVADFVLVAFPMLAIFVSTITLSLASYARTVLLDATIEGARYAALADRTAPDGVERTKQLMKSSLGSVLTVNVNASKLIVGELELIKFVSTAALRVSPQSSIIRVSSVATREIQY